MTLLVPEAVRRAVGSTDYPALANGTGVVLLVLLIVVLVELQLLSAYGSTRFRESRLVHVIVVPMVIGFAFVVALRIAALLPYH